MLSAAVLAWSLAAAATPVAAQPFTIRDVSPNGQSVGRAVHAVAANGNAMFLWALSPVSATGTYKTARYDASSDSISATADLVVGNLYSVTNLTVDQAGNATAVGFRSLGAGKRELGVARYASAVGTWGSFSPLMSPLPQGAYSIPDVLGAVVDAQGDVTVVWVQATCEACSTYALYAARSMAGGAWSVRVIATDVWHMVWPSVIVDASGNVLAVAARSTNRLAIMAARYTAASDTWTASDGPSLSSIVVEFQRVSAVAAAGNGRAMIVVQDSFGLVGVSFDTVTGTWANLRPVSSTIAALDPAVAADQSGNFIAMWNTALTGTALPRVLSRRYSAITDTWGDAVEVATVAYAGRLVSGPDGTPTAVWHEGQTTLKASRYSVANGGWSSAVDITSAASLGHLHLVGLSPDATGSFRTSWLRRAGESGDIVLQTTRWQPANASPGTPGNLRAAVTGSTVSLTWNPPVASAIPTGYTLIARLATGGPVLVALPLGAATSFSVNAPDGTFVLSVAATNDHGTGPESAPVTVTVTNAGPPPGSPSNLSASVSGATVSFSWSAPTSGGAVGTYVLVAGVTPGFSVPIVTVPLGAAPAFAVSDVPAGTYYVRVLAQNGGGTSAPSNEIAFTVAGLAPPGVPTLQVPSVNGSTVHLSWTAGAGGAPASYTLIARVTPGGAPIVTVPLTGTGVSFPGVPSGTYYLALTASNGAGTSPPSADVTLVVP